MAGPPVRVAGASISRPDELRDGAARPRRRARLGSNASPSSRRAACAGPMRSSWRDANRIAHVLVDDMRLVPGNRVLLRGANSPAMAACWFAVIKAGGIAVATMSLLRARELTDVITKAQISHALCDARLADELNAARAACPTLREVAYFASRSPTTASRRAHAASRPTFANVDTAADDTALIAFTSGTTGQAEGHDAFPSRRDGGVRLLAADDAAGHRATTSSPAARRSRSLSGSGGLLLFPLRIGAATLLVEKPAPDAVACRDRRTPRDRAVHRADVVSRDGAERAEARPLVAAQMRLGRRGAAGRDAAVVEGRDGHRDHRRHRLDGAVAHLHFARRGACPAGRDRQAGSRVPGVRDGRRGQAAAGRAGRPARGQGTDRLPLSRRSAPGQLREERLELHRRRLPRRRRRLFRLPGAHRRHDRQRGLQHRRTRSRERAAAASGRCRMRRRRRRRSGARPDRQGVRRAEARAPGRCRDDRGAPGLRQADDRAVQVSARDRVPAGAAAHRNGQAAAVPAANAVPVRRRFAGSRTPSTPSRGQPS